MKKEIFPGLLRQTKILQNFWVIIVAKVAYIKIKIDQILIL